jgi:type I restriction enzyme, S subunit
MVSEWPETTLGREVDLLTGFPFKSERYTNAADGIRLVRGDNIVQGALRWDGVKTWPAEERDEYAVFELQAGDVVLAMDRPWIEAGLKYAAISRYDLPCLLVQRTARLRGGPDLDSGFLRYLIGSQEFTQHVHSITTGTAVPHISGKGIREFSFARPPLVEQQAVARILGTLDDKIELNQRMNETLEAMARVLFKSWFVDFDPVRAKVEGKESELPAGLAGQFPSEFEDSEVGEIPKGWKARGLDQVAKYLNGLALQKYPQDDGETLAVIKIAQLRKRSTEGADRCNTDVPEPYIVNDGDVLFSWSGSLEVVVWCSGKGALNQHLFKVTSEEFSKWFYYLWTLHHLPDFRLIAADKATTMGHIQRRHLSEAKAFVPPKALLEEADKIISPLLDRIIACQLESRHLATLRDTLLPKLISGDLRLEDPERFLREED